MSKISYSAWKKYMTCPQLFAYHYNDRLRPKNVSSALAFGSAIDEALNALLLRKEDPVPVFQENFRFEDLQDVDWDGRDFDPEILCKQQKLRLEGQSWAYKCWASMRVKGRMLLDAYVEQIYPLIEKVHSVQKEIEGRPGFLDAVVDLKGYGKVLIDHKTSARPYPDNAVSQDTQLALYAASEGIERAGFIVLQKEIQKNRVKICSKCEYDGSGRQHKTCPNTIKGKRCGGPWDEQIEPEAIIQVLIDGVPEINKTLIQESISQVETGVKCGVFPKNLMACGKMYGKPCPYIKFCWNGSDEGLEVKKEEKK